MLNLHEQATAFQPSIPNLKEYSATLQAMAIETWKGRMLNEYDSASVFEGLAMQFQQMDPTSPYIDQIRQFAQEERHHGVLCASVVRSLGGHAIASSIEQPDFPMHEEVSKTEAILRNILSICCLSETIAVALIGAEREDLPDGELKTLLTKIWADECGHANFGWRLLRDWIEKCDLATKVRLSDYLKMAFWHLEEHELQHLPLSNPPKIGLDLGICSGVAARGLFYATVEGIIVPSLESMGLNAQIAWRDRSDLSKNVTNE